MSWIANKKAQKSLEILGQLAEQCSELGGPLTAELYKLVQKKDYLALVNYTIDYNDISLQVNDAIYARQLLGFYQKLDFLKLGFNKAAIAADRFVLAERMCRDTNRRFKTYEASPNTLEPRVHNALSIAERKIRSVLGDVPSLDKFDFSFGSGSNTNVEYALACPRAKLGARLQCSANLAPTVARFLHETPHWTSHHAHLENYNFSLVEIDVVPGKVGLVPKNAKTDRTIETQPLLNGFFQKGVGTYMRDRLLRSGVDLRDQSINQRLAQKGSATGALATVDLSMASDCVSRALVWNLLPFEWACLLDELRCPEVNLHAAMTDDIVKAHGMEDIMDVRYPYRLEKFSSMGNGYTFELESVIFYGLCCGVCEVLGLDTKLVSVYGDDLIIPVEAYELLDQVMQFCGFALNLDKSFAVGPFRESCGADYFNGFDIRPFYQKTLISERTLFTMHNWLIRHGEYQLAKTVDLLCNPVFKLYGPDGFGDGHLIGCFELRRNRTMRRDGWCGGYFDTYKLKENRYSDSLPGDCLLPIYSVYTRSGELDPTDPDIVKGSSGYAKISIYTLVTSIFSRKV